MMDVQQQQLENYEQGMHDHYEELCTELEQLRTQNAELVEIIKYRLEKGSDQTVFRYRAETALRSAE